MKAHIIGRLSHRIERVDYSPYTIQVTNTDGGSITETVTRTSTIPSEPLIIQAHPFDPNEPIYIN